jgi:hypothetical protein
MEEFMLMEGAESYANPRMKVGGKATEGPGSQIEQTRRRDIDAPLGSSGVKGDVPSERIRTVLHQDTSTNHLNAGVAESLDELVLVDVRTKLEQFL